MTPTGFALAVLLSGAFLTAVAAAGLWRAERAARTERERERAAAEAADIDAWEAEMDAEGSQP